MGALTSKNYSFELRGWEIQHFKSFDPTDGFMCPTALNLNKNNIVLIEPIYNEYENNWLNDKARYFFDTFFKNFLDSNKLKTNWLAIYITVLVKIYIFEHCRRQVNKNYLFTIVFDYLSVELLGLFVFLSKKYSFVSLKQTQLSTAIDTDLELNFQMNDFINSNALLTSNFCLLVATNPRYEGTFLHLNLRQKILRKNFKCVLIGSLINLMFPTFFLGTNINIAKTITEGNNFICQNFKYSTNPFLIYNTELFKRTDSKTICKVLKMLFYLKYFNNTWCGYNVLSSSISSIGMLMLNQTARLRLKDLNNFSLIYFININISKIASIKKIIELHLFKQMSTKSTSFSTVAEKKLVLDQNYQENNNLPLFSQITTDYLYIPTSTFYENSGTFVNTEGLFRRVTKLIHRNKIKSDWHILRKIINSFKDKLIFFNKKDNQSLSFNLKKVYYFKTYVDFSYYPIKKLTQISFLLSNKNKVFSLSNLKRPFKIKTTKLKITKLRYFINDFFNSNKDQYSSNSTVLACCSKQVKYQATNFF